MKGRSRPFAVPFLAQADGRGIDQDLDELAEKGVIVLTCQFLSPSAQQDRSNADRGTREMPQWGEKVKVYHHPIELDDSILRDEEEQKPRKIFERPQALDVQL